MSWFLDSTVNEGYPSNTGFPESYPATWSTPYNPHTWRIMSGVNDDYPFLGVWFAVSPAGSGDMDIGGNQTNYPNGFTTADIGGVDDQFNDDDMGFNTDVVDTVNLNLNTALSGKMFCVTSSELFHIITLMNDNSLLTSADRQIMQEVYGANIFDGIMICKQYPFTLNSGIGERTIHPKLFGLLPLYDSEQVYPPSPGYFPVSQPIYHAYMGDIDLDIFQAWEVEGIDYSIYLPYAGVFPVDVRSGERISVDLFVDLFTGSAEYYIKQNGQITDIHRTTIGMDFPLNFSQGEISANGFGWGLSTVTRLASPLLKSAATGLGGSVAGAVAGGILSGAADMGQALSGKFAMSAPQIGGSTGFASHPFTRIIAKIPKMFNGGYGYRETLGENRSTTYTTLSTCSGFVQCKNYKSDIIVATEEEKREIETLLNQGVFI